MSCKFLFNLFKSNYPDDIRKLLNFEYRKIHRHKKKIKNIYKHSTYRKFLWFEYGYIDPKDLIRIKRHKYLINKANKQIDRIKKYYLDK